MTTNKEVQAVAYNHHFIQEDDFMPEEVLSHSAVIPVINGCKYAGRTDKLFTNQPNTVTIPSAEYAKLKEDSERYRYMRNKSSVMLWDAQKWATSHRLDVLVDQAIKESK